MDKFDEKTSQITGRKDDRRKFLKRISKYVVGLGVFGFASLFGLKKTGDLSLGIMKNVRFGLSEAQGKCGFAANCAGGGGECGFAANCAGGGGKCGFAANCAGDGDSGDSSGGGQCGFAANCSGGGGKCGFAANCAGGGGRCGFAAECAGN